jgi:ATP synthase protein I
LKTLPIHSIAPARPFLDSLQCKLYGPRGLKDGRIYLDLLATAVSKAGPLSMPEDTSGKSENDNRSAEEAALSARLQRLGERLAHQKGPDHKVEAGSGSKSDPSALARGFRLSTELVAGVLVGAFLGWALDRWLGISPWGMIVLLLLGFAAGVVNVMRAAGVSSGPGPGR